MCFATLTQQTHGPGCCRLGRVHQVHWRMMHLGCFALLHWCDQALPPQVGMVVPRTQQGCMTVCARVRQEDVNGSDAYKVNKPGWQPAPIALHSLPMSGYRCSSISGLNTKKEPSLYETQRKPCICCHAVQDTITIHCNHQQLTYLNLIEQLSCIVSAASCIVTFKI